MERGTPQGGRAPPVLLRDKDARVMTRASFFAFFLASTILAATAPDPSLLKNMKWREVGPYRGGRSSAVEGIAGPPEGYYFRASGGGGWKTVDGGPAGKPRSAGFLRGPVGAGGG